MIRMTLLSLLFLPSLTFASQAEEPAWWERETAMAPGGILRIDGREWWERAKSLAVGESFLIEGDGRMVVRKEVRKRGGAEMIVWILDDDGDMDPADSQGDTDSDCYVVDYGVDGVVDRMVDYIDSEGDGVPNEMDIRYFVEGELRRSWMGMDLDGDGAMWDLIDYEYTGDFFKSDPYDENMIYMNKYNPHTDKWMPISECPFSFYDFSGDGHSDRVVRFSAAPRAFSEVDDPDYANSEKRYQGPHYKELEDIGVMNVRYSFDIDGLAGDRHPLHYEMGFNLIGSLPYRFDGMEHHQPLRRAPKTTICIPHAKAIEVSETYPADQTGFTWREFEDRGMKIGDPSLPEYDRRWEGVFWTWHRRIMQNTGGPVQDWNVRREFLPKPTDKREVYYSPVDRRIHLLGATEGWLQVGRLFGDENFGEIRMFDVDGDGFFDRWEYIDGETGKPIRVASVSGVENRVFGNDWEALQKFYTEEALPESIRLNEALINRLLGFLGEEAREVQAQFMTLADREEVSPDERRYILDLLREYLYYIFIDKINAQTKTEFEALPVIDPRFKREVMLDSTSTWERAVLLARIDQAYSRGDLETVLSLLDSPGHGF